MFCALPKSTEAQVLGKQVLRSGTSVGANYAEADSARSRAEFAAKMGDSMKEISETIYWLELLIESSIVPATKLTPLLQESTELSKIFATIISKSRKSSVKPPTALVIGH